MSVFISPLTSKTIGNASCADGSLMVSDSMGQCVSEQSAYCCLERTKCIIAVAEVYLHFDFVGGVFIRVLLSH